MHAPRRRVEQVPGRASDLVAAPCRDGETDNVRLTALFRAHYAELFAFVYRMVRDRETAEELVQDVFLKLWEHGIPSEISRSYLYAAARNHAINHLAHRRVTQRWIDHDRDGHDMGSPETPASVYQTLDLAQAARAAIQALPERGRQIFVLRRDHGLKVTEIAESLGLSVKTVETHLGRAAQALRVALAPYLESTEKAGGSETRPYNDA